MLTIPSQGIKIQPLNPVGGVKCKEEFVRLMDVAGRIKRVGGVTVTTGDLSEAQKLMLRLKSGIETSQVVA